MTSPTKKASTRQTYLDALRGATRQGLRRGLRLVRDATLRVDSMFDGQIVSPTSCEGTSGGGWFNPVTGLGTFGRDKVMQGRFGIPVRVPDPELAAMVNGSPLCQRIVTIMPRDMMRLGYSVVLPTTDGDQNENSDMAKRIEGALIAHDVNAKMLEALIWGGTFGGGLIIVNADDGRSPDQPLDEANIKSIRSITFVDRRWLYANSWYTDPFAPKYGQVETYQFTNSFGGSVDVLVHDSRCIRIEGAPVDMLMRRQLSGWGFSRLQAPYDVVRQYESAFQSISNLMVDVSQAVMKVNGLMQMISNNPEDLQTRMAWTDMMRSTARMIMVDAENEEFERTSSQLNGISDIMSMLMLNLAAASELPETLLYGRSPQGMNATGDSDFRMHYDRVDFRRAQELAPMLLRIIRLICLAKDGPTGGVDPTAGAPLPSSVANAGSPTGARQPVPSNTKALAGQDKGGIGVQMERLDGAGDPSEDGPIFLAGDPQLVTVRDPKTNELKKSVKGGVEIHWPKLWVPTEKERSEIYKNMSIADCGAAGYVGVGVLMPAEVKTSRFRNGTLNVETNIDMEAAKNELAQQRDNVKKGLPPVAVPGNGQGPNTDKPDEGKQPPTKKAA